MEAAVGVPVVDALVEEDNVPFSTFSRNCRNSVEIWPFCMRPVSLRMFSMKVSACVAVIGETLLMRGNPSPQCASDDDFEHGRCGAAVWLRWRLPALLVRRAGRAAPGVRLTLRRLHRGGHVEAIEPETLIAQP